MNNELMSRTDGSTPPRSLDERFAQRPLVRRRLGEIADAMDQALAAGYTADQAGEMAIEQVGKLGGEIMGDWAQAQSHESVRKARELHPGVVRDGEKNSDGTRHSER